MDTQPFPCRGVAEHAYCPRLFYYMTVEGIFVSSADTVRGQGVHRRVDTPSRAPAAAPSAAGGFEDDSTGDTSDDPIEPARPRVVRSLALTSERLGLTGKLDLAQFAGSTAIPIEYRKGKPNHRGEQLEALDEWMDEPQKHDSGPEPWPTDRVQVGLQVLLLEDAGYSVPEAFLYYASERLRLRVAVDDDLRRTALDTLERARRTAEGPRPPPLRNDPKCPRCSLHSICLPDEITHQRERTEEVEAGSSPRNLWPPRDDGIHVVTQREGVRVGVRGESVRVTDADGNTVRDVPLAAVESISVLGGVQVSTQALGVFAEHQVPVAFLSAAGRLVAMMDPLGPTSAATKLAQVRVLDRPERALELARALIVSKIGNQRTLLMRNHASLPARASDGLNDSLEAAKTASTMDELRGHEGNAAAIYFAHFAGMFKVGASEVAARFDSNGRQRRPPPDPINSVLSFAYSMLTNECVVACRLASLEPTIGALHTTRPGRPALALDLMEPFRPLIGDSVALAAFNRGELVNGHFLDTAAGCSLTDAGRKCFFSAYGRRLDTEVVHPVFKYRLSYRRMLVLHARLIAAWLQGEVPELSFLTTR